MTSGQEITLGIGLWLFGVVVAVAGYYTPFTLPLSVIGGGFLAIGIALIWCGFADRFLDEFEEDVRKSYTQDYDNQEDFH